MMNELNQVTERIIGCAFKVANTLGVGFLEKVYENALAYELRKAGLAVEQQKPISVFYDGIVVGEYVVDILVQNANVSVLVELKAVKQLNDIHLAQCLNYLKAGHMKLCLLINFGTPKVEIKRIAN
jgi:GxxExxY protein